MNKDKHEIIDNKQSTKTPQNPANCKQSLFFLDNLRKTYCTEIRYYDHTDLKGDARPPEHNANHHIYECPYVLRKMEKTLKECYPEDFQEFRKFVRS